MLSISDKQESLDTLLANSHYNVPLYQREYSWEIDEVSELYHDIYEANDDGHHLGTLLLSEKNDKEKVYEIIDGQQRLITLFLLLGNIRKLLAESNEITINLDKILFNYPHTVKNVTITNLEPRLVANQRDKELFKSLVKGESNQNYDKRRKSYKCLVSANKFLERELKQLKEKRGPEALSDLEDMILQKVYFIRMTGQDDSDKILLFKTLNARGLELSKSDLIKNEICHKLERENKIEKIDETIDKWDSMRQKLEEVNANIDSFFFHHINSLETALDIRKKLEEKKGNSVKTVDFFSPPLPEKYLFGAYEYKIKTTTVDKLLKELDNSANIYSHFIDPDDEEKHLKNLRALGAVRCYPLLLHSQRVLSKKEFKKLCEAIEILTFRHSNICKIDAKELESEYYRIAIELKSDKDIIKAIEIIKKQSVLKNVEPFQSSFKIASPKVSISKYILCRIHNEDQEEIDWDNKEIHAEHIMPVSPDGEWEILFEKDSTSYMEYLNRIGNITILKGKRNREASNKNYIEKCKQYVKSIPITKEIPSKWKEWNYESIKNRQLELWKEVEKIWNTNRI